MPQILAVDWDRHEARYVLASVAGGEVRVLAAESVSLVDVSEGGDTPHPDLSGSLAAALADQNLGRAAVLVGVERSAIELLYFMVPPASDTELPELVANQAMRESQLLTEQSVIDFLPIGDNPAVARSVIAAAMSPRELERIRETCEAAELKPTRMLLGPLASASLFVQTASPDDEVILLVNRITDEVDLTVMAGGQPVLLRTIRLPEGVDEEQATGWLMAEITRTLAAVPQTHLAGETVESIYLFGRPDEYQDLIERIRDDLGLPSRVFDPFESLDVDENLIPENPGRFAPLLGMLLDEAAGSHPVDFLHPRQPPKPVDRRRMALIAGAVLVVVVLGALYAGWSVLAAKDQEIAALNATGRKLKGLVTEAAVERELARTVRDWQARNVIWLDELRDLSVRFPPGRDMVVLRLSMSDQQQGGGGIRLQGLVRDPKIVVDMEHRIRDEYREVRTPRPWGSRQQEGFTAFESTIVVGNRPREDYLSQLPGAQAGRSEALASADPEGEETPQQTAPDKEVQQAKLP
jgi:Tfp pilus assembly PilM family ATPase